MNDYNFGNYIYKLRIQAGLSQSELGAYLGVTNKAVSKWEVGKAKPGVDTIRKLAALFGVSVDELLKKRNGAKAVEVTKIVITGGPCAGKSTAMSWVQNAFTQMGYTVLFVPETATELITGGVAPWTCGSNREYQQCQFRLQLEKENVFEYAAKTMNATKVLIVCDRGALDNKAYMDNLEFTQVLELLGTNEIELRDNYDAVFHLVTAAKGAEEFYTTANNAARTETVEEAAALDDKLISAWTGHPHFRVIDNTTNFKDKMRRLIAEISSFLGEPEPFEVERKFLIEYPDIKWLDSLTNCQRIEIIQTYLKSDRDEEIRVRQRGLEGHYIYFQTIKRKVSEIKRVEIERRLSESEYIRLLMNADTTRRQIRKDRYCLTYENQYFEIDVYPFWDDKAIVEIELCDENAEITFPNQIKVIKEVTSDESFKNASLALRERGN
ncbi:MAG: AAA family ATPase [Anaerolineaceae bacterium]|nr:AAA family ATPase [Anaerolineaceae bacterium]